MKIDSLNSSDVHLLEPLQPDGWNPIVPYYEFYVAAGFCNPLKCVIDNHIVGIGSSIEHQGTAWLAHIIVHDRYRRQGIGTAITQALKDHLLKNQSVRSIHLVATPMGEPLYRGLGFKRVSEYIFLRGGKTSPALDGRIESYRAEFRKAGLKMDLEASSEDRRLLLEPHWHNACFITNGDALTGFYMPALGEGYILATSPESGLTLLRNKHSEGAPGVIPAENQIAIKCLQENGYTEFRRGIRMSYGESLVWRPDWIYGRIGGNLG